MACNCNNIYPDCDMNRWSVCQSIDILTNYYTKQQIDEKLDDIVISGGGVTVDEVQEIVDENLEDYYTKDEIDSGFTTVNNELDNKLDVSAYTPTDLSNYYTISETNVILERKEDKLRYYSENTTDWNRRNGKIEIEGNSVEVNVNGIDLSTNEESNAYLNGIPIVNEERAYEIADEYLENTVQCGLVGESYDDSQWNSSGIFRFKLSDETPEYTNTLPALTYSVTRYSGNTPDEFVISPSDGTGQYKKGNATLRGFEVEGYQKTLSAGTGIVISGNVISATGGTTDLSQYWTSAETQNAIDDAISGITGVTIDPSLDSGSTNAVANSAITNALDAKADVTNVYNKTEVNNLINNKIICLTQNEYDSLITKQSDTLYLIYEV